MKPETSLTRSYSQTSSTFKRWLPSLFSLSRLPVAWGMFRSMDLRGSWMEIGLIWLVFSDGLDGWLARRFRVESVMGRVIDHVVDKAIILLFAWGLTWYRDLPSWTASLLSLREVITAGVSLRLWKSKRMMPGSRLWGRVSGLLGIAGFAAYYYEWPLRTGFLWAYLVSLATASLLYARVYLWRTLRP